MPIAIASEAAFGERRGEALVDGELHALIGIFGILRTRYSAVVIGNSPEKIKKYYE
jgi:hypothetical protein